MICRQPYMQTAMSTLSRTLVECYFDDVFAMNKIIASLGVIEATAFVSSLSCCICVRQKKCILLFGSTKKAVYVRNSLASYLGEESNRNIPKGELRSLFQRTMPMWSVHCRK